MNMDKKNQTMVDQNKDDDDEEPAETCFNNDLLEFKFLPEDDSLISMPLKLCLKAFSIFCFIDDKILETYSKMVGEQTKSSVNFCQKLLMNGIRLNRGERGGFICVVRTRFSLLLATNL